MAFVRRSELNGFALFVQVFDHCGMSLPSAYWRLSCAAGVNSVGSGAFAAAVPLLAVTITDDPRLVSVVSAAAFLPWLVFSLPAGAIIDRYDRVRLMWQAQLGQAVAVGAIAVLAAFGAIPIWVLAALAFVLGAGEVVVSNAAQAILPDLVAKPLLHRANGYQQSIATIGQQFAGPAAGGALFAVAAGLPFGLDAVSFAVSAVLLSTLPRPAARTARHPPMRAAIKEGVRWLARHRLLRALAILLGVNTFCFHLGNTTLILLATRTLGLTASGYGLLLAGAAAGSLLGGLVNARVVAWLGEIRALILSLALTVLVFAAIGLSPNAAVLAGLLAVNGFLITLWNIVTVSLRQELVPSGLLGRVTSVYRLLGWGLIPLGALAGGLVAHSFGFRAPYPVAGALRAVALVAAVPVLLRARRGP